MIHDEDICTPVNTHIYDQFDQNMIKFFLSKYLSTARMMRKLPPPKKPMNNANLDMDTYFHFVLVLNEFQ